MVLVTQKYACIDWTDLMLWVTGLASQRQLVRTIQFYRLGSFWVFFVTTEKDNLYVLVWFFSQNGCFVAVVHSHLCRNVRCTLCTCIHFSFCVFFFFFTISVPDGVNVLNVIVLNVSSMHFHDDKLLCLISSTSPCCDTGGVC